MSGNDPVGRVISRVRRATAADVLRTVADWGLVYPPDVDRLGPDAARTLTRDELRGIADRLEHPDRERT